VSEPGFPRDRDNVIVSIDGREVRLTNLRKVFWPELRLTKGDLIWYYARMADVLLPHLRDRAMVMKRYPHGAAGEFFFMKRAPTPRPDWIRICPIDHGSSNVIDFPMIQDRPSLMWVINLGCIDWQSSRLLICGLRVRFPPGSPLFPPHCGFRKLWPLDSGNSGRLIGGPK